MVCGSNDPNIQIIVNAINEAIGAGGKTIDWNSLVNYRQGIDAEMVTLTADLMRAMLEDYWFTAPIRPTVILLPINLLPDVKKCPFTVSYSEKMDETTELCKYVIPSHHWLECLGRC